MTSLAPMVAIMLPQPLTLGGVTTWACSTADVLRSLGYSALLLAPPTVEPREMGANTFLHEALAATDDAECIERMARIATGHLRLTLGQRTQRAVVLFPQLSGACMAGAVLTARSLAESGICARVVGWGHTVNRYDAAMLARFAPALSAISAVSEAAGESLRSAMMEFGVAECPPVAIVRTGVADTPTAPAQGGFRDPVRLIYTGRLAHDKGVRALAPMMQELERLGLTARLTVLGDGVDRDTLARTPGVQHIACIPRADLKMHLAEHDFFVLPSRAEGLGLSRIEAALAGCVPVVLEHSGGALEGIIHSVSGLIASVDIDDRFDDSRVGMALAMTIADAVRTNTVESAGILRRGAREAALSMFNLDQAGSSLSKCIALARKQDAPRAAWEAIAQNPQRWARFTVPPDATERVTGCMAEMTASGCAQQVAWLGAGAHARAVLSDTSLPEYARPGALVDDDPARWGEAIHGVPIIAPDAMRAHGITDLLLTSWLHHQELWRRRARFERLGARVHPVYPIRAAHADHGAQASTNAATTNSA